MKPPRSVVRVTRQAWKVSIFEALIFAGGGAASLGGFFGTIGLKFVLLGTLVAFIAFCGVCMFVRCPRCSSSWYWMAVSQQPAGSWQSWLKNLSQCPHCGFPNEIGHFDV